MTAIAAKESGLASEFISNINSDENAVMRELYLSTNVVQQAVIAQDRVIKMIAEAGSCMIIGRSADYVLRHKKNLVRIFIYAPKDYRTKKVMEMYGDTWDEGRKNIERSDTARAAYYKNISGKNGATHINMNSVLTAPLVRKSALKLFLNIFQRGMCAKIKISRGAGALLPAAGGRQAKKHKGYVP